MLCFLKVHKIKSVGLGQECALGGGSGFAKSRLKKNKSRYVICHEQEKNKALMRV